MAMEVRIFYSHGALSLAEAATDCILVFTLLVAVCLGQEVALFVKERFKQELI